MHHRVVLLAVDVQKVLAHPDVGHAAGLGLHQGQGRLLGRGAGVEGCHLAFQAEALGGPGRRIDHQELVAGAWLRQGIGQVRPPQDKEGMAGRLPLAEELQMLEELADPDWLGGLFGQKNATVRCHRLPHRLAASRARRSR
ncbi:hypothetical protein RY27_21310 [Litorilinea aerophila]|nr:hypothetical protein RY27_21310 [Litorilinea aerophila]